MPSNDELGMMFKRLWKEEMKEKHLYRVPRKRVSIAVDFVGFLNNFVIQLGELQIQMVNQIHPYEGVVIFNKIKFVAVNVFCFD
jgi:hypothetical protein